MCLTFLIAFLCVDATTRAGDWTQLLGPTRNGVAPADEQLTDWPARGPRVLWSRDDIGAGYAGPVVLGDRAVLFHRPGHTDVVECLDVATGETLWKHMYPAEFRDSFGMDHGPRATPTIDAETRRVYTHGSQGMVHCLDLDTGKVIWRLDTAEAYRAPKGWFGRACSPLIEGHLVLLNIGGTGGIIALRKDSGEVAWEAPDHEASYASPVAATFGGKRLAVFFTREGFVALAPKTGDVHATHRWRPLIDASVNAANPIVVGDLVFLSTSYDTGAILLRVTETGVEKVWSGESMSNHYPTCVHHEGFLYGFDGRQEFGSSLRCIELRTGEVRWNREMPIGSVTVVGDELLILTEDGVLRRGPVSPERFAPTAEVSILGSGIRAYPALSDGRLLARDKKKLVCIEVGRTRAPAKGEPR